MPLTGTGSITAALIMDLVNSIAVILCVIRSLLRARKENPSPDKRSTFCFFTTDSNLLCAASCMAAVPSLIRGLREGTILLPHWLVLFRYAGTVAVTVTFLTVMFFLGPTQGYRKLLSGHGFWLHLACPLLGILSLVLFEKTSPVRLAETLWGFLPTFLYSIVYLYNVILRKPPRWQDFYGYNRNGKWYLSIIGMYVGTMVLCFALMVL